jgi:hypothetical protein
MACSGRLISGCGVFKAACSISFGDTVVVLLSFAAVESLRLLLDQGFEDSSNADVASLAIISSVVFAVFCYSFMPVVDLGVRIIFLAPDLVSYRDKKRLSGLFLEE